MTNQVRGVVTAEINGERLSFRLSTNEWCELEDEFGVNTKALLDRFGEMADAEQLDMKFMRSLFRAAVSKARPTATLEDAGELMAAHGLVESARLLGEVVVASMPEVKAKPAGKPKGRTAKP